MLDELVVRLIPIGMLLVLLVAISPILLVAMRIHRGVNREK
jgi:hypothetical protein